MARTMLTATTMFYVSSDPAVGNDANDGTSPSTPKRTLQNMLDTWHRQYDQAGYQVQFQLMDSAFTYDGFSCRGGHVGHYGYPSLPPSLQVIGNPTNPALTHIHGVGMTAVEQLVWGSLHLDYLMLSSDTGSAIASRLTGSEVVTHNLTIGACGSAAIYAEANSNVLLGQDIQIVGDCPEFLYANKSATIENIGGLNITANGARNFGSFFIGAARNATIDVTTVNFLLAPGATVTGKRWAVIMGGQIDTNRRNPDTLFPGSANGSVGIGGGFCG
jgi:hypothetical protein